jgi:hypothetical protein
LNTQDPFAPEQNIAIALMTKHTDEPIFSGVAISQQRINSTIAQELSRAIGSAHSLNFTIAAVACNFGMNIENWHCEDYSISD